MSDWIVAEALERLRAQLNALAPNRSKVSDGTIGDLAHQKAGTSDHLPRRIAGVNLVTALDVTHDPGGGMDCGQLRDALLRGRDPRIRYIIYAGEIIAGAGGPRPWTPRRYAGPNGHYHHLHLSVVGWRARDGSPWPLPGLTTDTPTPSGVYCRFGERNDLVRTLQQFMTSAFPSYNPYRPTGYYGLATAEGIAEFQKRTGITGPDADGKTCGPRTMAELRKHGFTP